MTGSMWRGGGNLACGLSAGELCANPHRVFAEIQDCKNLNFRLCLVVVDAEWKSVRQHPIKPEMPRMDAMKKTEALDIGEQRVGEVVAKPAVLRIIEVSGEDDDRLYGRGVFRRERSSETERNFPCPASTFARRAARTS